MLPLAHVLRKAGYFLRRRDLLALGYTDKQISASLASCAIFRVRQGWFSVPDAPSAGVMAVRVGGRLTGLSALESMGLPVPRQPRIHVAVPPTGSRLRAPDDRRLRLNVPSDVTVHWDDKGEGGNSWRVSAADSLLAVLRVAPRDVALACCGLALQRKLISERQLEVVFAHAPQRVQPWQVLVSALDEAHGETYFRLLLAYSHIPCTQQVHINGVGRFDFRLTPHLFVEIDGAQHDPSWKGGSPSSWADGLDRDAAMAAKGIRVLHFGYRQLYVDQPAILAAIERSLADDAYLAAWRRSHPSIRRT
jgi:very-short-patch-repair endonuclease